MPHAVDFEPLPLSSKIIGCDVLGKFEQVDDSVRLVFVTSESRWYSNQKYRLEHIATRLHLHCRHQHTGLNMLFFGIVVL